MEAGAGEVVYRGGAGAPVALGWWLLSGAPGPVPEQMHLELYKNGDPEEDFGHFEGTPCRKS